MGPQQQGYSWTSTSQWSQLPTVPANGSTDQSTSNSSSPTGTTLPSNNGGIPTQQTNPQPQSNPPQSTSNYNPSQQQNYTQPQIGSFSSTPPETRRDMITRLYRRILARDPDNAGLNYYLYNSQIPEVQVAREMYESTEHQDSLQKAKDVREIVKKLQVNDAKLKEIEVRLENAENISKNYRILLDQKTQIINDLRQQTGNPSNEDYSSAPQVSIDSETSQSTRNDQPSYSAYDQYEESTILNDPFADDYVKGKGCMGTIRRWFSFR